LASKTSLQGSIYRARTNSNRLEQAVSVCCYRGEAHSHGALLRQLPSHNQGDAWKLPGTCRRFKAFSSGNDGCHPSTAALLASAAAFHMQHIDGASAWFHCDL
jgi:hypothetical protein